MMKKSFKEISRLRMLLLRWDNVIDLQSIYIRGIKPSFFMATNEELEKRIEILEKEVQHLKAVLQYQMRSKKK